MAKLAYTDRPTTFLFEDKVLNFALLFATAVHVIPITMVSFESQTTPAKMMQEVAEVWTQDNTKRKKADFIAASNQKGSGSEKKRIRMESLDKSPLSSTHPSPTLDIKNSQKRQSAQKYMQSYLRTTLSIEKIEQANKKEDADKKANEAKAEEERVLAQIATLEAQVSRRQRILAKASKVKTLTSAVDAEKSADATYINHFRKKVEQIGNTQYPEVARAQNLKGDVRLQVRISPDGMVQAIRLLQSSGSALLDEFAKDTVRRGAPYGKFNKDMDYTEVRIIRTWRFTDMDTVETFAENDLVDGAG